MNNETPKQKKNQLKMALSHTRERENANVVQPWTCTLSIGENETTLFDDRKLDTKNNDFII